MNVTETLTEGLKREFKVVISANDIDTKINERLSELAPTLRLPGFRPGKVPTQLVKKRLSFLLYPNLVQRFSNKI